MILWTISQNNPQLTIILLFAYESEDVLHYRQELFPEENEP